MIDQFAQKSDGKFSFAHVQFQNPEQATGEQTNAVKTCVSTEADNDGSAGKQTSASTPSRVAVVHSEDWDVLFRAIESRLRLTATGPALATTREGAMVLECVDALHHLHAALTQERSQNCRWQSDVLEAKTLLSQLRLVQEYRLELLADQPPPPVR